MSLDALHIILPVAGIVVGAVGGALGTYLVDRNNAESKVAKADAMVNKMIDDGTVPPVLMSANLDGGDAHNAKIFEEYADNICYM